MKHKHKHKQTDQRTHPPTRPPPTDAHPHDARTCARLTHDSRTHAQRDGDLHPRQRRRRTRTRTRTRTENKHPAPATHTRAAPGRASTPFRSLNTQSLTQSINARLQPHTPNTKPYSRHHADVGARLSIPRPRHPVLLHGSGRAQGDIISPPAPSAGPSLCAGAA